MIFTCITSTGHSWISPQDTHQKYLMMCWHSYFRAVSQTHILISYKQDHKAISLTFFHYKITLLSFNLSSNLTFNNLRLYHNIKVFLPYEITNNIKRKTFKGKILSFCQLLINHSAKCAHCFQMSWLYLHIRIIIMHTSHALGNTNLCLCK